MLEKGVGGRVDGEKVHPAFMYNREGVNSVYRAKVISDVKLLSIV